MYVLRRLIGIVFLAGIGLICVGTYDAFIQVTAGRNPETISISDLQKRLPWNRHLIVTGGTAMVPASVEYYKYKNRYGKKEKIPNSEIYFIPIQDSSASPSASAAPPLVVRMTKEQADKVKAEGGFPETRIEGLRMTHWDLESEAKEALVSSFGKPAVERMVVLEYKKQVLGIWQGLGQLVIGLLLVGGIIAAKFRRQGIPQQKPTLSPPVASKTASRSTAALHTPSVASPPIFRRRTIAFAALVLIFAAVVTLVVLVPNRFWKRLAIPGLNAPDNPWADWQLPVRIGYNIEAVRATLGQDESNWGEKGLGVSFENDHVSSIYVYTIDRWPASEHSHVRKYDGSIIAGVNADDSLEQLIQKLGKPSKVTDFDRNEKDYQWRRTAYVINARIAMEDLVSAGLPFKKHQVEGVISIDDIAPYLQAERDEELRREMLEKEKGLVTLSGAALSPKEIFQKYSGRVVEVQAINSKGVVALKGTGFIWRRNEVLTNYHVIEEARSVKMQRGSQSYDLGLTLGWGSSYSQFSKEQDWVQLGCLGMDTELPPVACAVDTPEIGENVTVIGNPEGLKNSLSTGIVAGVREINGNQWIQITAPVSPGSSGSPVFDSKGLLIGLATMMLIDGQNLNFAIPISQILASVSRKAEWSMLPLRSTWNDEEFQRRKEALSSGTHTSREIDDFAQEFLKNYSDPADKAEVFSAAADAYSANGQFRTGVKVLRKKIEVFGADTGDYLQIADMLKDASDAEGMKRASREGIMCGVRQFAKQQFRDWSTAWSVGQLFDKIQDRDGAERWFDIDVGLLAGGWRAVNPKSFPQWYRPKWSTREKTEVDLDRLIPKDPEAYIDALRQRWRSQVEKEVVALLQSWGLPEEKGKQFLRIGIDSIPAAYWEEQIRPKLTSDQWLLLRAKLDERKSL